MIKRDVGGRMRLWKWRIGMTNWQQIVPSITGLIVPLNATRFFVDPYRPDVLYVLDTATDTATNHIFKSEDGGTTWAIDILLESVLTENGAYPFEITIYGMNPDDALLRDMSFDPNDRNLRFACGPAGVFITRNGSNWEILIMYGSCSHAPK